MKAIFPVTYTRSPSVQTAKPAKFQAVACLCPNMYSSRTTASLFNMLLTAWLTTVMYCRTILVDTYEVATWEKPDVNNIPVIIVAAFGNISLEAKTYTIVVNPVQNTKTPKVYRMLRRVNSLDSLCLNFMATFLIAKMMLEDNAISTPIDSDDVANGFPAKTTAPVKISGRLMRVDVDRDVDSTRRWTTALVMGSISLMAIVEEALINAML